MSEITIPEMVRNGTMSAEMAAVIWAAVDEQVSFLTVAIPRFAGKTTTSKAALTLRRPDVPVHWVDGSPTQMERLKQARSGGYLAVEEFDRAPMPGYIWGEPVRRVFETAASSGYAVQGVLHASGVEEAVQVITRGNGVSDAHASILKLILYIERFGADLSSFYRRVTNLYELERVEDGKLLGRSLYRWDRASDGFPKLSGPRQWGRNAADLASRTSLMQALADTGRTSSAEALVAIGEYRNSL